MIKHIYLVFKQLPPLTPYFWYRASKALGIGLSVESYKCDVNKVTFEKHLKMEAGYQENQPGD